MAVDLNTGHIRTWRSIVTLIVFVLTNLVVLFPFHIPVYVPRRLSDALLDTLSALRIISPRQERFNTNYSDDRNAKLGSFVRLRFPVNFITAPLIADLFLLAILAIGRREVHDGTIGADNISPIYIMLFFLSLAYIAISIDASGLIRYLAFKVLQSGGNVGHRLFFYLYAFFFGLSTFVGNDPVILSGTAFLAYMTRVSENIQHPRAWIHAQFAVANIASAILVSSNPTNLVLAGAFSIKFINYSANMVVPVVATAVVLFPFLLYIVFANEAFIPTTITMHKLSDEAQAKTPVNPNIPHARGNAEEVESELATNESEILSLEEIMNPFLDKKGAAFGGIIMATTLITLLAINAATTDSENHQAFWVTLPGAVVQFCWDVAFGWRHRMETRETARRGREEVEHARAMKAARAAAEQEEKGSIAVHEPDQSQPGALVPSTPKLLVNGDSLSRAPSPEHSLPAEKLPHELPSPISLPSSNEDSRLKPIACEQSHKHTAPRQTLVSLAAKIYMWLQETFPTATAVVSHLPFPLVPFALAMFVLVQALVTRGWVPVFAYGWDHWVNKTGTVGSIGGMGFLSVILCNFAGTNIGTAILLCRVIQAWQTIHQQNGIPISNRTFWATVYAMALGVNYGAFSTAFSASLAGLLWRDILARKHIYVHSLDFARVNLPIIAIAMTIGCAVLIGQVYIIRDNSPYDQ